MILLGLGHVYLQLSSSTMPPKKKASEPESGLDTVTEDFFEAGSPAASSASSDSSASSATVTSEQLERILESNQRESARIIENNQKSMAALIATLVPAPPSSGSRSTRTVQIKPPKWVDDEVPHEYFNKFEKAMLHNEIPKSTWGQQLPVYLAGRAQAALAQVEDLADYGEAKSTLLDSLGDTPASADRKWWSLSRSPGENPSSFYLRVRAIGLRRLHGLDSVSAITEKLILSRYLSLLPADCYAAIVQQQPKTGIEASRMVQDFEETRAYARRRQPWKDSTNHSRHEPVAVTSNGSSGSSSNNPSSVNPGKTNSSKSDKVKEGRKPIICHSCNEPGHIRPNCPNRVRRVKSPAPSNIMLVKGRLAGSMLTDLRVDTGADRTLVRGDFVPQSAYTGKTICLDSWRGAQVSEHHLAQIPIEVDGLTVSAEVAVVQKLDCPALLGRDLGPDMTFKLLSLLLEGVKGEKSNCENNVVPMQSVLPEVVRTTRAQSQKAKLDETNNDIATEKSGCDPLALESIFDFDDQLFVDFETEHRVSDSEVVPTPLKDLEGVVDDVPDIPLPKLCDVGCDNLSREQEEDPTLKSLWSQARAQVKGYSFVKGVLVHTTTDELHDDIVRIVVPNTKRQKVLELAHSHLLAGHFGRKKTYARLSAKFLWPRMWHDVQFCSGCQLSSVKDRARVPLQPLQLEHEPFSKVAFDLVGPLPRTVSGHKYILTMMDLYTKFPAAVPLKKVDNLTVIEALMDIFSCFGLPKVLLTDQGSVFTSKLTTAMCQRFGISKIQTTPYHPQSNGALEKWHACLKRMIKSSNVTIKEWDKSLKYLLFAYRCTPHCTTGYPPFTLLYGRDVRGPLEILHESWLNSSEYENCNVFEWLTEVKARLKELSILVAEKEGVAKSSMKDHYDKSASNKIFVPGEMVLVWKPGIHAKMGASWEGPYLIKEKVSPVTYSVMLPGNASRSKVLHANLLKKWTTAAASIHRVAVIQEEVESEDSHPVGLQLGCPEFVPSASQQVALDNVLSDFPDVLQSKPGRTHLVSFHINTGDHAPVASHPYRIAPRWRDEVKQQLDQLLQLGIIQPSFSPWSSSIVTVKKNDGGIRICIDYRAVNAVTQPDPYQMPLIDDILEALSCAKFISKVDLNKGFHQIPVDPAHYHKTAFCTPWGKYEFKVMPFGVRNGPAIFQRLMDQVLHRDHSLSVVYIDDIAIFSSSWEAHCGDIAIVLGRLREAGLTVNLRKCLWGQTHCEFLGHLVGAGKVAPAELKVLAVKQFAQPTTKKQIRQFLGLAGYYRRFVSQYASHSVHLTEATRKSAPERVIWSEDLQSEFLFLKHSICSSPCLTLPVVGDVFLLQTDASGTAVGAVLSVIREEVEHPVAYFSRKLLPRERKYSASELEGLAVVNSVCHFDAYLLTHPFTPSPWKRTTGHCCF